MRPTLWVAALGLAGAMCANPADAPRASAQGLFGTEIVLDIRPDVGFCPSYLDAQTYWTGTYQDLAHAVAEVAQCTQPEMGHFIRITALPGTCLPWTVGPGMGLWARLGGQVVFEDGGNGSYRTPTFQQNQWPGGPDAVLHWEGGTEIGPYFSSFVMTAGCAWVGSQCDPGNPYPCPGTMEWCECQLQCVPGLGCVNDIVCCAYGFGSPAVPIRAE